MSLPDLKVYCNVLDSLLTKDVRFSCILTRYLFTLYVRNVIIKGVKQWKMKLSEVSTQNLMP